MWPISTSKLSLKSPHRRNVSAIKMVFVVEIILFSLGQWNYNVHGFIFPCCSEFLNMGLTKYMQHIEFLISKTSLSFYQTFYTFWAVCIGTQIPFLELVCQNLLQLAVYQSFFWTQHHNCLWRVWPGKIDGDMLRMCRLVGLKNNYKKLPWERLWDFFFILAHFR